MDTGASHCYASQAYVEQAGIPVRPSQNWLKLADNTQAVSNGTCTLALDLQTYSGPIECFVLPLSDQFDLILGDDWCNETGCEISYRDHCLKCNDHDGRRHSLIIQSGQQQVHCPVISAVNLNTEMEKGDVMYLVDVTCVDENLVLNGLDFDAMPAVPEDATLQELLDRFADRFPLELPAELPPVRNVYHCIPLKNNEPPAPPKSYRLSRPDLNRPFEVICDACGIGLGAVLLQDGRPIAFEGKRMSPAEQNYHVGEQELLAVVHALELWRCYLISRLAS